MKGQNPEFEFSRREREALELFFRGVSTKRIAGMLELSITAVNAQLNRACEKAGVSRSEMIIYLVQHPEALIRGSKCTPTLHPPTCTCGSYCQALTVRGYRDYAAATIQPAMQS